MAERRRGNKSTEKAREYMKVDSFKIIRAHEFDNGNVSFDMLINGVQIYRLSVVSAKDSDRQFIGFPSYQSNGKWYNYVYLPLSEEDSDRIIDEVYNNLDD